MGTEKTDVVTESSHLVNRANLVKIGLLAGAAFAATALFTWVGRHGDNESITDTATTES